MTLLEELIRSLGDTQVLAVLIATGAGSFFGGIWFWAFGKMYNQALGPDRTAPPAYSYFLASILSLAIAIVLWAIMRILGKDVVSNPAIAVGIAAMLWVGFAIPALAWPAIIAVRSFMEICIEGGNWLAQTLLIAIVLYFMMW